MKSKIRPRVLHTLDALAAGGIRDHLGGGFHRYSTDAKWLVPHFEIMLYDLAMLAWCYAEASRQTREPRYAGVTRGVLDFVLREMTSPEGAFYTAMDAEVDGQEGLNYLWTPDEVEAVLGGADAKLFNRVYGLDRGPNFADPHHGAGIPDKNILFLPKPIEEVARELGTSADKLEGQLQPMRQKLKAARDRRKQPLLDTKVLTSWNALMIRALAHAGDVLGEPIYLAAARRAAEFLLEKHRTPDGGLYRTSREGQAKYNGFVDDHAFLARAMLALADAGAGAEWRERARELVATMNERFGDDSGAGGFYFTDRHATDLIVRQKTAVDSPLPSGNAEAAMALLALGEVEGARATIAAFAQQLAQNGEGMSSMVQAVLLYLRQGGEPFTVSAGAEEGGEIERPASPQQAAERVVRVGSEWVGPTELHLRLSIDPEYHINAHEPGGGPDVQLVPTRVDVEGAAASEATIDYPPGDAMEFPFAAGTPVRVYSGAVTIALRFAAPLRSDLRLSLTFQPCDDRSCLPPVTKRIVIPSP